MPLLQNKSKSHCKFRAYGYYTPKTIEIQAVLFIFAFFVNYANSLCKHRYVNLGNYLLLYIYQKQLFYNMMCFASNMLPKM